MLSIENFVKYKNLQLYSRTVDELNKLSNYIVNWLYKSKGCKNAKDIAITVTFNYNIISNIMDFIVNYNGNSLKFPYSLENMENFINNICEGNNIFEKVILDFNEMGFYPNSIRFVIDKSKVSFVLCDNFIYITEELED